jgi:hypothetical protein
MSEAYSYHDVRQAEIASVEPCGEGVAESHDMAALAMAPSDEPAQSSSEEARRRAAVILEVLAGIVGPTDASRVLGIGVQHYYQLERRALCGLILGCEPQPKGPRGPGLEEQLAAVQRELADCRRECLRQAALVRITQRAIGLPASQVPAQRSDAKPKKAVRSKSVGHPSGTGPVTSARPARRKRRPAVRALRALEALRGADSSGPAKGPKLERMAQRPSREVTEVASNVPDKEVSDGSASR